jgi:hypothetical protein
VLGGAGGGALAGGVLQPDSTPKIAPTTIAQPLERCRGFQMGLLLLEALAALVLLVFIVWWVMFAGRRKGERDEREPPA